MNHYLLLLHETPTDYAQMSPQELQGIIAEYTSWAQSMAERERLLDSRKLCDEGGRSLTKGDDGLKVVDGPYMEAKEIIGGLFVIAAGSYEEAVELSSGCPHLDPYDLLVQRSPSPVPRIAQAVAIARGRGVEAGIECLEALGEPAELRGYHLLHAVRGALEWERGDVVRAAKSYRRALECRCSEPERRFLEQQLGRIEA